MEKINQLETEKKSYDKSSITKNGYNEGSYDEKNITRQDDMSNLIGNYKTSSKMRNESVNNQSINITDFIDDNEYLKEKFENLKKFKDKLKLNKKENKFLGNEISNLNKQYFYLSKIFIEGLHELSKELLKIHEIKLDKIVQSNLSYNCRKFYSKFDVFRIFKR